MKKLKYWSPYIPYYGIFVVYKYRINYELCINSLFHFVFSAFIQAIYVMIPIYFILDYFLLK